MSKFVENSLNNIGRTATAFRCLPLLLLSTMMICSLPAHAQYSYQFVRPPEAELTQTMGINNAGMVTGGYSIGDIRFSFIYDMKSGEYTDIDTEMGVLDISNSGVMVGDVDRVCAIRDKKGNITLFFPPAYVSPPAYTVYSECQARGVNSDGKVSGYVQSFLDDGVDEWQVWTGFIHDPKKGTYEEFLTSPRTEEFWPPPRTIAHAINAQGQNVGNVYLSEGEAYDGSSKGWYGYLRQTDGSVKYFEISQSAPGWTTARGISESGLITGFYYDSVTFEVRSYVTTLSNDTEFETITLTDDQVLYQTHCDATLLPPEEGDWVLFTDWYASQIRNDGVVVGGCSDTYWNLDTDEYIFSEWYGFIATPIKKGRR